MKSHENEDSLGESAPQSATTPAENSQPYSSSSGTNSTTDTTTTSTGSSIQTCQTNFERPAKLLKTNTLNHSTTKHLTSRAFSSYSSHISISPSITRHFRGNNSNSNVKKGKLVSPAKMKFSLLISEVPNKSYERKSLRRTKRTTMTIRKPSCAIVPIMAEQKKRREIIEKFMELSSIVPGFNKMEETSIIEDAIEYLKQLQKRVNMLEEQKKKTSGESIVFVEKTWLSANDDTSPSHDSYCYTKEALPGIETRAQEKNVLIKVHCEKQKDYLCKILSEIEKVHLNMVNMSALPFGDYFLDITVVAQMGDEFCMTMKDLKTNLQLAFAKFM